MNPHVVTSESNGSGSSSGLSLAMRLREGSRDAWRDLVDLYGPLVDRWCGRFGLDSAARADVAQDVFLAVHLSIAKFDPHQPGATFRGWLWRITRNKLLERTRHEVDPTGRGGSTALAHLGSIPDPMAEEAEEHEPSDPAATASLVRRALEQIRPGLEEHTWEAFWRTAALGQPAPQVAAELGISPASVRQAKSRVLRRLRRQLGDRP